MTVSFAHPGDRWLGHAERFRQFLQMLACIRIPAPLPAVVIGAGPDILIVENSDTYWVAAEILGGRDNHPIGALAWGCGKAFP